MPMARFTGKLPVYSIELADILGPMWLSYVDEECLDVTKIRDILDPKTLDDGWSSYDTLCMPAAESRSSEAASFSKANWIMNDITFFASHR
jgi:hypothetical protein